jgi:hypothetical protein
MTVKIIDEGPDPSVVKECICKNCGVKLQYVPKDVQKKSYRYFDESRITKFIICPSCEENVYVD